MAASENLKWERSSFCANGTCAEVASDGEFVYLRNSQEPGTVIKLDRAEWAAFRAAIVDGQF
ncbi:DUF397 domain-containing protein [Actinoplanes sp. NPDC049265]|uniref:DUF397 domain-containing protein n=1 Tax=Actinoplanes sp. NPDC049265 TaxID=3363902 RepID=UPI00371968F1